MKAIMLAAGLGSRLSAGDESREPKVLLQFGGLTLLERHVTALKSLGVESLTLVTGYRAGDINRALDDLRVGGFVRVVENPRYREGSVVSLWAARETLRSGGDVVFMDADVLYHPKLLERLLRAESANCFLFDREFEAGDEPVKLCLRGGHLVEFRKIIDGVYDRTGEWVGFLKLSEPYALQLASTLERFMADGRLGEPMEEAVRELLHSSPAGVFGICDVTDLPWIEIDFADDVVKAREVILPAIEAVKDGS